jgi:hypothetical protein
VCPDLSVVVLSRRPDIAGLFADVKRLTGGVTDDSEVAA